MRMLYLDESGTSAADGTTVVAGLLVDADRQWLEAKRRLERLVTEYVPPTYRQAFLVHSTNLLNGRRNPDWSRSERTALLMEVAALPGRLGMPLCLGVVRRGSLGEAAYEVYRKANKRIKPHNADHLVAFQYCLTEAERFLRGNTAEGEIAVAVYEDTEEMRSILQGNLNGRKVHPCSVPAAQISEHHPEVADIPQKIIDVPHFVGKAGAPLLQIADVCAFIVRCWLEEREKGAELLTALTGQYMDLRDFQRPHFGQTWIGTTEETRERFDILATANIHAVRTGNDG